MGCQWEADSMVINRALQGKRLRASPPVASVTLFQACCARLAQNSSAPTPSNSTNCDVNPVTSTFAQ